MRFPLYTLALTLVCGPVMGRPVFPEPDEHWLASSVPYEARFVAFRDVARTCGETRLANRLLGCAIPASTGPCTIIVPTQKTWPGTPESWAANFLHELAHCANWPANHPTENDR